VGIETEQSIQVGLLEDDSLARASLSRSFNNTGIEIAFTAKTAGEFLSLWRTRPINLALLDCHLGDGPTGIDVARKLRQEDKDIALVFLTSFEDPRMLAGENTELPVGSRYLTKQKVETISTLVNTMREAVEKPREPISGITSPFHSLSDSQIETLGLVAQGLSNAEIAKRQFVSEKTVENHIRKISKELNITTPSGMNSRVHFAKVYLRAMGLTEISPVI